MTADRAARLIDQLALEAHPEGGFFREIYRSASMVDREMDGVSEQRCALTTIYFLLRDSDVSRWHVVRSDEAWHFYEGDALELLTYQPAEGALRRTVLGGGAEGHRRSSVVAAGTWQAARPLGSYALVGCTVGPGFEFSDFCFVSDLEQHRTPFRSTLAQYSGLL